MSLIDMPTRSFLADDDWHWFKSVVQANESSVQIALTPQGNVRLLSRERGTPSDRGVVQLDMFQGTPQRRLSLTQPHSVDEEEKAFLT